MKSVLCLQKQIIFDIMAYDEVTEVIEELFGSIFWRYQIGLQTSMKGSDFFDLIN